MNETGVRQDKVILFDGVCSLCNRSVKFILEHEKAPVFRFASIQSEAGKELLKWCGLPEHFDQAIVLIDGGKIELGSTAALKIGATLKFPWSFLAGIGRLIPKFFRDWFYRQIARHRYQWFGKNDACTLPTEPLKTRFL